LGRFKTLSGAFARGKSTGGTKAPPYGFEEGFLKLTTLPPGEGIVLPIKSEFTEAA